jgi:hypothetical protein
MDSVVSWVVLATVAIIGLIYFIKSLPMKETHAYDAYNAKLEKSSWL